MALLDHSIGKCLHMVGLSYVGSLKSKLYNENEKMIWTKFSN